MPEMHRRYECRFMREFFRALKMQVFGWDSGNLRICEWCTQSVLSGKKALVRRLERLTHASWEPNDPVNRKHRFRMKTVFPVAGQGGRPCSTSVLCDSYVNSVGLSLVVHS